MNSFLPGGNIIREEAMSSWSEVVGAIASAREEAMERDLPMDELDQILEDLARPIAEDLTQRLGCGQWTKISPDTELVGEEQKHYVKLLFKLGEFTGPRG